MHIFLTGDVQCGKSTVIRRALEMIDRPVYGFRTLFTNRKDDHKALYMLPASYQGEPQQMHIVTQFDCGRPHVLTERFDALGSSLLKEAQTHPEGLILMDECSRFERDALLFQQEILRCLDGDIPVLGVVRLTAEGWVDQIRNHPKVRLITVTLENRDTLPQQVANLLLQA